MVRDKGWGASKGSWSDGEWEADVLLWRRVLDKVDPLFDVALQSLGAGFEEFCFSFGYVGQDIESSLRTRCLYILLALQYAREHRVLKC
jgi:hypothetical protein